MRTLQQLAAEALAVQDACNLCGVAQGFARAMIDLRAHCNGTGDNNRHAIVTLWLDKLADLNGRPETPRVFDAYAEVTRLAEAPSAAIQGAAS
jgi:hypothetical protein